jgi:hypothetical protein
MIENWEVGSKISAGFLTLTNNKWEAYLTVCSSVNFEGNGCKLHLKNHSRSCEIGSCSMSVLNQNLKNGSGSRLFDRMIVVTDETTTTWSSVQVISLADLVECDGLVVNGSMQVKFTVRPAQKLGKQEAKCTDHIHQMLFDSSTSDVTLIVGNEHISAHKLMLSVASPVFKAMFQSQMAESNTNSVTINDCSADVVRRVLSHIYGSESLAFHSVDDAEQFLPLVHMYQMAMLAGPIVDFLTTQMSETTALRLAKVGNIYSHRLKMSAFEYITDNTAQFFAKDGFVDEMGSQMCSELFKYIHVNSSSKASGLEK